MKNNTALEVLIVFSKASTGDYNAKILVNH